jgi:hypothetical protein
MTPGGGVNPNPPSAVSPSPGTIDALRAQGYTVIPPSVVIPHACALCGATDLDNESDGYGPLVDVEIRAAYGEEGTANPTRYFCQEHLNVVCETLVKLGFGVHRHGGINYLEVLDCPGVRNPEDCPTPVAANENGDELD